jgi:ABC-2 type transport system ATP-binding protein
MIVGLDRPTSGSVTVNGHAYARSSAPLTEIGALLEARAIHTGRTARNHLLALAATHGIPHSRVDAALDLVGLREVARKRVGSFSLGMGQRLGIASALLGDPKTVILDEPVNGLDPDGILWIRTLLKNLAAEGRTVFVSSHLMSEMAQTADHIVVIGRGRVMADTSMAEFLTAADQNRVRVRTPDAPRLRDLLSGPDVTVSSNEESVLIVDGLPSERIGEVASANAVTLYELVPQQASLEEAYMELTRDAVEYQSPAKQEVPA